MHTQLHRKILSMCFVTRDGNQHWILQGSRTVWVSETQEVVTTKRAAYAAFYRIMRRLSYLDIPLDSGDFCVISKRVAQTLRGLPEKKRFVRGLRSWAGFRAIRPPPWPA